MRNQLSAEAVEYIGRLPQPLRTDLLRLLIEPWYKSEQEKLTHIADGAQLRQAQGATQILGDISKVLAEPEAYRTVPVPARRSFP